MAITTALQNIGEPLGTLTLTGADQALAFTVTGRKVGYVELYADDAAFLYAFTAAGPYARVPAGGSVKLPINVSRTIQVQQDSGFLASTLRATCVG